MTTPLLVMLEVRAEPELLRASLSVLKQSLPVLAQDGTGAHRIAAHGFEVVEQCLQISSIVDAGMAEIRLVNRTRVSRLSRERDAIRGLIDGYGGNP